MTFKRTLITGFFLIFIGAFPSALTAQRTEIYVFGGGYWPTDTSIGQLRDGGVVGFKAGSFLDERFQIEGGLAYINHFDVQANPDPSADLRGVSRPAIRGLLYDANGAWNFAGRSVGGTAVAPYLTLGVGGLTALVKDAHSVFIMGGGFPPNPAGNGLAPDPSRQIELDDGDTFFNFNYGGGIKILNLWGPVGVRADLRGRTIPNFYGQVVSWPELTGGVSFSWGER